MKDVYVYVKHKHIEVDVRAFVLMQHTTCALSFMMHYHNTWQMCSSN